MSLATANIIVVLDQQESLDQLATALRQAGHEVAAFNEPMEALRALDTPRTIEILVTSVRFSPGNPHGIALARMIQAKHPLIRVIFAALPNFEKFSEDLEVFAPLPVNVQDVGKIVNGVLHEFYRGTVETHVTTYAVEVIDRLRGKLSRSEWLAEAALRLAWEQSGYDPMKRRTWDALGHQPEQGERSLD